MVERLEVGSKLHAKHWDGEFYPAEVLAVSESKKRAKAPVQVRFVGYGAEEDAWLGLDGLKSKKLPAAAKEEKPAAKGKAKAKAKAEPAAPRVDFSGLEKGAKVQALADGVWYNAEVLAVRGGKNAGVKVNYCGYTSASDEWLGADRLKSKAIKQVKPKGKAKAKAESGKMAVERPPRPALVAVPMLTRIKRHAAKGIEKAIVESAAGSDPKTISYKDLYEQVQATAKTIAALLAKRKEGTPKHVAYLVNPSIAYVVTELAVWAAGAACVPLSVHSPAPELDYYVQDAECPLVIADPAMASKIRPVAESLGRIFAVINPSAEDSNKFTIDAEGGAEVGEGDTEVSMLSNALILYTSGTTGKPKGVVHTFRSLSAQYASLSKAWRWTSKDYTLHVLPLHHIHGVQNILNTALYNGAGVEFTPFDAGFCMKRLGSGDVTCFHAVPTIYVKFTQHLDKISQEERQEICKGLRTDKMRYMVSGSAALPVPTMQSWAEISGHVLLERYGMTEIGMGLSNKIAGTRYPGCVGWPLPFVRAKVDEDGAILIKGATIFKEYYKKPEITKKEFTEDGWFRTGDNCQVGGSEEEIQKMQDDAKAVLKSAGKDTELPEKGPPELGKIYKILGRTSVDIIKSGGYKISALEIESVLAAHESIKECAVIGVEDETWGEKVTAIVIPKDGCSLTLAELREWGKVRMATYKVPQALDIVDELPRNQMGKLEKKKLIDKYKVAVA